jgi:hypothetical protein
MLVLIRCGVLADFYIEASWTILCAILILREYELSHNMRYLADSSAGSHGSRNICEMIGSKRGRSYATVDGPTCG